MKHTIYLSYKKEDCQVEMSIHKLSKSLVTSQAGLISLVRMSEYISCFSINPVWTSGSTVADRGELPVVAVLAVDVLLTSKDKFYLEYFFSRKCR